MEWVTRFLGRIFFPEYTKWQREQMPRILIIAVAFGVLAGVITLLLITIQSLKKG